MFGCFQRLVLLPIIIAVCYPLFSLRPPFPTLVLLAEGAEVAAFLAGLCIWFGVISWLDMRKMASDLVMTRNWKFHDGERTVVLGRIEAQDRKTPLLEAPFSGKECVGYYYAVTHHSKHPNMKRSEWTDYEGYALIPSIVRGPIRTLNILAEPDKELFHEMPGQEIKSDEDWSRAEKYLNTTDFGERPSGPLAITRTRLIHKGPGNFRQDQRVREPPKNLRNYKPDYKGGDRGVWLKEGERSLNEKIIKEGDTVLIVGEYSEKQGGIAPDPDSIMRPFRLSVGGDTLLRRKIRNRIIGMVVSAGLALVVFAFYFIAVVPQQS